MYDHMLNGRSSRNKHKRMIDQAEHRQLIRKMQSSKHQNDTENVKSAPALLKAVTAFVLNKFTL